VQAFLKTVREAASSAIWSRGVELCRAEAVSTEHEQEGEIALRVSVPGALIAPSVTLYLDDEEWECSCSSTEDPCEHVAAASIALHRARKDGRALPSLTSVSGGLRYCLSHHPPGLAIEREIVTGDETYRLESSLDAIARGRVDGPRFIASSADLLVESVLGPNRRGSIPPGLLPRLFSALEACTDVHLDGRAIDVIGDPLLPRCRVVDAPGGFRLFLEPPQAITRALGDGVVVCGGKLRLLGEAHLSGRERQELPRGIFFSHGQVAELLTEVLPPLAKRIRVEIDTDKLPETSEGEKPRIQIQVERVEDRLSVLPLLVYGDPPVARLDGNNLVHLSGTLPIRDKDAEAVRIRDLRRELGLAPGHRIEFAGHEAVEFSKRLENWRETIAGTAHRDFHQRGDLEAQLAIEGDRLDLRFTVAADGGTAPGGAAAASSSGAAASSSSRDDAGSADAGAVLRAWHRGESLVPLAHGGFAALPQDWLSRFGHRVTDLLEAQSEAGRLPTCALPDLARLCDDLGEERPAIVDRLTPLIEGFDGIPEVPLPADFVGKLRGYQQRGVDWLCYLRDAGLGALLADDMGLGKTVQALCALESNSLVVCPTSLLFNWKDELDRFRPGLRYALYHGPKRELDESADVILTSYAILRLDADRLTRRRWNTVVLDEAQNIKNPDSQVAKVAFRLDADSRIALTGTPVENRLDELWSQLQFLNRGLLGSRNDFRDRYTRPISDQDETAVTKLRERIRPFLLRRRKREVAPELPPRTEVVIHCELSESERQVYDAIRAATMSEVVSQLRAGGSVLAALEALLRLRQAACHPSLVPGQEAATSSKIQLLVSRLSEAVADGHRALVFSQWTYLESAEIEFARLDGSTRDRGEVVRRFQSEEGPPVMLVSLKAGGTGLNLTAADHIFLLDPWWNPAVEDQAADRAHRIGQTRPVVVHRLVAQETVEEGILALHERKRALSEAALGGADAGGPGLTREDLLNLLS